MMSKCEYLRVRSSYWQHHTYCTGEILFDARKVVAYYNSLREVIPKITSAWGDKLHTKQIATLISEIQSLDTDNIIDLTDEHHLVADLLDIEILFPELEIEPFTAFCSRCQQWWKSQSVYREDWYYWKGPRYAGGGRAYYCFNRHKIFTYQDWIA